MRRCQFMICYKVNNFTPTFNVAVEVVLNEQVNPNVNRNTVLDAVMNTHNADETSKFHSKCINTIEEIIVLNVVKMFEV